MARLRLNSLRMETHMKCMSKIQGSLKTSSNSWSPKEMTKEQEALTNEKNYIDELIDPRTYPNHNIIHSVVNPLDINFN